MPNIILINQNGVKMNLTHKKMNLYPKILTRAKIMP